jgi:UDP-glucose 4-epimerase
VSAVRSCVVTGATGLLGPRVVAALARTGVEVHALGRRAAALDRAAGVHPHAVDLAGAGWLEALPPRVDAVVHLAQSEHFRRFPEQAGDLFEVNVSSTFRLLEYARRAGARRFVLASSGGVYGAGERPFVESDPVALGGDLGFYLATKASAETLASGYSALFAVVTLRPFFMYGAGQNETMLLPRLARSVRSGTPIKLQGHDGMRLNPIHVDDAARAVVAALALDASLTVNLAGPEVLTMRGVGEAIGRALDATPRFEVDAQAAPRHLVGDVTRLCERLVAPTVRLERGAKDLLAPA